MTDTIVFPARRPVCQTERQLEFYITCPWLAYLYPQYNFPKNLHLYLNRFTLKQISLLQLNSTTSYLEKWSFNCMPFIHKLYEMSQGCTRLLTPSGGVDERQSLFFFGAASCCFHTGRKGAFCCKICIFIQQPLVWPCNMMYKTHPMWLTKMHVPAAANSPNEVPVVSHCILTSAQSGRSYWILASPQFEVNILVLFCFVFLCRCKLSLFVGSFAFYMYTYRTILMYDFLKVIKNK